MISLRISSSPPLSSSAAVGELIHGKLMEQVSGFAPEANDAGSVATSFTLPLDVLSLDMPLGSEHFSMVSAGESGVPDASSASL
jgi:hypothetical protein